MKLSYFCLLASVCAALSAAPASANYLTSDGMVVEPRDDGFFIPYRGQSGAVAFWCAAGEYAQAKLGLSPTTMIYRTSEPPRRSGEGIGFSLSAAQSATKTGLIILGVTGGGLSIASARNLCDTNRFLSR